MKLFLALLLSLALLAGCSESLEPVSEAIAADLPVAADAPESTATPEPIATPEPTAALSAPAAAQTAAPVDIKPTIEPVEASDTPQPSEQDDAEEALPVMADVSGLSNEKIGWYFMKNNEHKPPRGAEEIDIAPYGGYFLGDTSEKNIYLTFDEGYENGYTGRILDILKDNGVKAAFFATQTYIRDNKELCKRIVDEGHILANHSVSHPSFPSLSDEDVWNEILETARYSKETTGQAMPKLFRPPSGEYSERTLALSYQLGYKTIFWSYAYKDWDVNDQIGKDAALKGIMDNLHNGEIILLHAVSSSNAEALPDFLQSAKDQGYQFRSLHELP
ncbi:MAG: polysaccharide deacetylase family protein [Clostridiales bacterium]|jgi:peptidoglycan-N-acetylmuramic acid deacetylase|nr:polysaccharide deacetylase family protein [Clostridiales bacterium]